MKFTSVKLDALLELGIFIGVFILILVTAHRAIVDTDIWLHLKTGEIIFKNRSVPSRDIFSFTIPRKPWVDHEWLFQLIAYLIYAKWGANGLIILQSQVITLSFLILFLMGYRQIRSLSFVSLLILMAAYASRSRFNIRPDIFSMLFFSLYLYLLRFFVNKRLIYLLIPIQILWVNMHGYFFLGPLLVLLFIISEFLRQNFKFLPWQWKEQPILGDNEYSRLKRLFFFLLLACLSNPNFLKGALYPLWISRELILGRTQIFFERVQELKLIFKTGGYSSYTMLFYYSMLAIGASLMLINYKKLRIIDTALFFLFFLFSLRMRNVAFFLFLTYTLIIYYTGVLLSRIPFPAKPKPEVPLKKGFLHLLKYSVKIIIVIWLLLKIDAALTSAYYDFESKEFKTKLSGIINQNYYPKKAVDFILENNIAGNMLNDFNSGAYLIGRTYPKRKVFIDGRTELYGPEFLKQLMQAYEGDVSCFQTIINKYNITAFLANLTHGSLPQIINHIYKNPQWILVFFDEEATLFLKDIPSNQALIRRYKINLNSYSVPQAGSQVLKLKGVYPLPYIKRANLFYLLERDDLVILESKEALRIMPDCFKAYHLLGKSYLRKQAYQEALENLRQAVLISPQNAEALTELGYCLRELKETQLAIDTFKRALKFNKRYAPAYYHLGSLYLMVNNETEAIHFLNKAARHRYKDASYHLKLGEALCSMGKKSKDNSYLLKAKEELILASKLNIQANQGLADEIKGKLKDVENYLSGVK